MFTFSVKRIKVLSSSINEVLIPQNTEYKIELKVSTNFNTESNQLILRLNVAYLLPTNNNDNKHILDAVVQNVFEVQNLAAQVEETKLKLPFSTMIAIVSITVSQSRALIAQLTAGTTLDGTLIPVINPEELTRAFYPDYRDATLETTQNVQ